MLLFYTHTISPRLQYILDFFNKELFDEPIRIINNKDQFKASSGFKLNYSSEEFSEDEFFLRNTDLLFESGIRQQQIECFELNFHKAFYQTSGDFPFDIFAASFYLLTRYEEYLPHEKDSFGRFAHTSSLAFRENFLNQPLVNIWLNEFRKALLNKFPTIKFRYRRFSKLITYDIDIAYSYLSKGFVRTVGGFARSLANGKWNEVEHRWEVLAGEKKDPYDCYEWLDAIHLYCRVKPYYFFLLAKKQAGVDRNTTPGSQRLQDLIEYCSSSYDIGIHPSWQSGDNTMLLKEEKEWLEVIINKPVEASRQHYIRMTLPVTYRFLEKEGIKKEFSMGYGSINGFRASVCSSFAWYDLEQERTSDLVLYPFCFMDANSFFEQKQSAAEAYQELIYYYEMVKKLEGLMITIWHNHILGTDPLYKGWNEMFEVFMKETVYWDAYSES
jgi:hypothetical protein